jgi:hypothetical protein
MLNLDDCSLVYVSYGFDAQIDPGVISIWPEFQPEFCGREMNGNFEPR